MKLITEQWRNFIKEQEDEILVLDDFETIGDLRTVLNGIASGKKIRFAGKILKTGGKAAADAASGGVTALLDFLRLGALSEPQLAKQSPILNALAIDPFVSRVVDDSIEKEFIKFIGDEIDGKGDEEKLNDMNMTNLLTKYIARDYDDTVVKPPGR